MVISAKYLVETDWTVYYLRGREPYVSKLKAYWQDGLSISVISLAELYEGVFRAPNRQDKERALKNFLTGLDVVDVTQEVARTFGRLRAELRSQGITVADLDLLIMLYHSRPCKLGKASLALLRDFSPDELANMDTQDLANFIANNGNNRFKDIEGMAAEIQAMAKKHIGSAQSVAVHASWR